MQPDEQDEQSEAFIELYEVNATEQAAQTVVQHVRSMIQHRARYERIDPNDFSGRGTDYYDTIERELSAFGFETLGDFEDAGAAPELRGKSFVRFALGAHGAIAASWFETPGAGEGEWVQCLVLHSWLDDGRTLVTSRQATDSGLPVPPDILLERVDLDLETKAMVRTHGERVAASGQAPRRMAGLADLLVAYSRDELKTSEFREAQGTALFEPLLRAALGESYDEQGEPILDAIQRHPEWMRGEGSSEPAAMRVRAVRAGEVDTTRFPHLVIARIPEHIGPIDRGERYESPLQDALAIRDLGAVTGGGTQLTPTTEIEFVDVELALADLDDALGVATRILEEAGAPVGSRLLFEQNGADVERPFGAQEMLALYLDGVGLPDEVYEQLDLEAFVQRLTDAVESVGGEFRSSWGGPTESAFYHYGPNAATMLDALRPVFQAHPVCQNARLVMREGAEGTVRTLRLPEPNGA